MCNGSVRQPLRFGAATAARGGRRRTTVVPRVAFRRLPRGALLGRPVTAGYACRSLRPRALSASLSLPASAILDYRSASPRWRDSETDPLPESRGSPRDRRCKGVVYTAASKLHSHCQSVSTIALVPGIAQSRGTPRGSPLHPSGPRAKGPRVTSASVVWHGPCS